jgi:hypothetical protein
MASLPECYRVQPVCLTTASARILSALPYPPQDHGMLIDYITTSIEQNPSEDDCSVYYLLLDVVHQEQESVSFQDRSNPAEQYARSHFLDEATINRIRGYWCLDHDMIEVSSSRFSDCAFCVRSSSWRS